MYYLYEWFIVNEVTCLTSFKDEGNVYRKEFLLINVIDNVWDIIKFYVKRVGKRYIH